MPSHTLRYKKNTSALQCPPVLRSHEEQKLDKRDLVPSDFLGHDPFQGLAIHRSAYA